MEDLFSQLQTIEATERRVAMATLVATRGTAPKKEGAKMWVGEGGQIVGSVTIGGCVDARVIEEADEAIASGKSRVLSMPLGDEDAWELGFTCAGTIQVMIEPIDLSDPDNLLLKLYRSIRGRVESGECAALATNLEDTSRKMLVSEDGTVSGSFGDPALDQQARSHALDLIQKRASRTVVINEQSNRAEVFIEIHGPKPTLIVFGAGHLSMPLVSLAKELGFRTVVVDGRPRFATRDRFPDADEVMVGIPSEIAGTLSYNSSTFVVLTAHDYKYDVPVLKAVLKTDAPYVGMLGGKKRGQSILGFLRESGFDSRALDRVRVPIGLDIGAQTAAEIALSILAEAIAVKANRPGTPMKSAD